VYSAPSSSTRRPSGVSNRPGATSTIRDYATTIDHANEILGAKVLRKIGPPEIAELNAHLRGRMSDSTRAKHLRVLGALFESAIVHGFAGANPVRRLPVAERPRPQRREAAYYEDEELPRLFAAVDDETMAALCKTALGTGMRFGELAALRWGDVDLAGSVIRVRRSVVRGIVGLPKSHERRDVDLTPELVELLGAWWGACGKPGDETLVFPGDAGGEHLDPSTVARRALYPALKEAGIERMGPTGTERTFHSFRHTYARIALEAGCELTWLSRQLGHSSSAFTDQRYGHWARAARKRQVERLAGAFAHVGA